MDRALHPVFDKKLYINRKFVSVEHLPKADRGRSRQGIEAEDRQQGSRYYRVRPDIIRPIAVIW
jgi:hypothetical protein